MNTRKRTYKRHRHPGVRPKGNGKWIIDYCDHHGRRHQRVFIGCEKDAVQFRTSLLVKVQRIKAGLEAPPEQKRVPTLEVLWQEFEADRQIRIATGSMQDVSLARYQYTIKALRTCLPALMKKPCDQVTPEDMEAFKLLRLKRGIKPDGINTNLRNLKAIFHYAIKKGYLSHSPLSEVPNVTVNNGDVRFLSKEELLSLKRTLQSLDMTDSFQRDAHDLVVVYLYTGCRARELLVSGGFDWNCVGEETLVFNQSKQHRRRVVHLSEPVRKILQKRRGSPRGPFDLSYDQAYKRVKYVLKKAGIPEAGIHTLRKTAGAWYYIASRDIFATSQWLGHSNVVVTQKHYMGLIQVLKTEYDDAFEHLLTEKVVAI